MANNESDSENRQNIPEELGLPAPYAQAVVQPSEYDAPTAGGKYGEVAKAIYEETMSRYNELKNMYQDQTDEAKLIRSSWETAPSVRIENGRFKLSGSSSFLKSAEAKQLREAMKQMEGNTYNTEDLNQQIEAWNSTLSKMSEQYMSALGTMNAMNAAIEQSPNQDVKREFSFSDIQKIGNSIAVGRQQDARTTKNKIFVGYEWDDKGNRVEKWVEATDFFNEFNNTPDENKRQAYHDLVQKANRGDVGAYSKLMYLQGGSQGGPANVDIDGTGVFFENILHGAEAGAAGIAQDIFDYAPILNLRTIGGNISDVAEHADQRNFWDWAAAIMAPGLYADRYDTRTGLLKVYNDAVEDFNNLRDWSNTYTAELNPASTEIGRTVGDFTGGALRIAGDIYAFGRLGQLEANTKFAAMQIANQKFAGSRAFTPMGQIYIKKIGRQVADQVANLADNGGVTKMGTIVRDTTTVTPFGGIYVPTVLTKISPKFTRFLEEAALAFTEVQFARNASQFISKDGATILQFGTADAPSLQRRMQWGASGGIAWEGSSRLEPVINWGAPKTFTSGSNIRSAWELFSKDVGKKEIPGGETWFTSNSTALSNTVNFSRSYELLKSLRNKDTILGIAKGLQTAQALSNLVGFAALRNVDDYFQRVEAGEDVGDMADYIITHTAEDAVWGGLMLKAGGMIKFFKRGADASAKPTVEYVQEVYDGMSNSQSGWYMPGTYTSSRFLLEPGALSESEVSDLSSTLSTVMTTNGEAIVGFSGELGGVSAVPDTNIKEAGKALGVYSPSKITRLSVRPTSDGAYLVREETNLDTNTKTETRQFYKDIEEATKAAGAEAVPKTSPKTISNSDALKDAKVAPLTIDGKRPNVMPNGVSQVRVEPGIVYRTPDELVDELAEIFATESPQANEAVQSGVDENNEYVVRERELERNMVYSAYERALKEMEESSSPNAIPVSNAEAPDANNLYDYDERDRLIKIAAWAKVHGYNLIPIKTPVTTKRVKISPRNQKVILGKAPSDTTKSIIAYDKRIAGANKAINQLEKELADTDNGRIIKEAKEKIISKTAKEGVPPYKEQPEPDTTSSKQFLEEIGIGSVSPVTGRKLYVDKDSYMKFNGLDDAAHKNEHVPEAIKDFVISKGEGKTRGIKSADIKTLPQLERYLAKATDKNITADDINDALNSYSAGEEVKNIPRVDTKEIEARPGIDIDSLPFDITNDGNQNVLDILDDTPGGATDRTLREYYRDKKGLKTTVVLMRPETYIKILRQYNTSDDILNDIEYGKSTAQYTLDMKSGDKFPTPVIQFSHQGFDGQEGRHRAIAARNNGFEYIPVGIRHPVGTDVGEYIGDDDFYDITDEVADIVTASKKESSLKDWQDAISNMDKQRQKLIEQQNSESAVIPTGTATRARLAPDEFYGDLFVTQTPQTLIDRQARKIPEELRRKWYAEGSREARDEIARRVMSDKYLRNAALSKMYNEWKKTMRSVGGKWDISYEDWLNTDITLYRWSGPENANYSSEVLSFSFEPGGYQQFGDTPTVIVIKPRETVGMADFGNEGGEQEVFVPAEIVKRRGELDSELKERQHAAILASGKNSVAVDDIKTFPEVMTRDTLLHGVGMGDLSRGDLLRALITNKITIYANEPISDGVIVSPVKVGPYSKEVNLSDVAWTSATRGIMASDTVYPTLFDYATYAKKQNGGEIIRAKTSLKDEIVEEQNNFVVTEYGVPVAYFPDAESALEFASQSEARAVHELSDETLTLDRPPVTVEEIQEDPLLLGSGASNEDFSGKLNDLLQTLPELKDSDIDYVRGVVDAVKQVRGIYNQVAANVNLDDIYRRYAQSIYDGTEVKLTPDERRALKPLTDALNALGLYFDPSGKSLTQEFYLPTGAIGHNKVSIAEAMLGEDDIVDVENPADGGLEEILIDADRIGDSGFWQKRTGDLFKDAEGNFTMSKAAPLEDNVISYAVSALTRGPYKLTLAVNNEIARSKMDPNRTQITAKQARAMLQEADTLRTKTRAFQLGTNKDADKIAKLKENYTGDESTVDEALKEKNYAKKLNYTRTLNSLSQKGGFNQFLDIHPIKGSMTRFGAGPYKGTANIRRKMEAINITGTMYKYDYGHWENYGFGLPYSQANTKKYGVYKDGGGAINLGDIVKLNLDSTQQAIAFYGTLKEAMKAYYTGQGEALQTMIENFARSNFPLHTNISKFAAKLMKEFGKNYAAADGDLETAETMNIDSIDKWIRTGSLICFNNAIQMGDISNLDERTIEAIDDAAAYLLVGSPVKRSTAINVLQRWSIDAALTANAKLMIGNIGSEIFTRLPGYVGWPATVKALVKALNRGEFKRVKKILEDLPLHFDDSNASLYKRTANRLNNIVRKGEDVALTFLTWSELVKNVVYYLAGEDNAKKMGITDPAEIEQSALEFMNQHAIAGGRGTTPGVAESSLGRTLFIFKTFTVRNFDDFLDFVNKASHGESGDNYWDEEYASRHKGDDKRTVDIKIAARVIGGRAFRSYIFWLLIGSYFGKTFLDALGGDPTGILEGGYDRGLYDDPDTDEYEGMTDFDNFINNIPAGFILGALQDLYFAARRRGVEQKQFFGIDIFNDPKLGKELQSKLPLGVAKNRLGDMLSLLDRGYSFSGTGRKTYAAPTTVWDLTKGFLFGKSTTANSLAYGKYRYGTVNIWGDIASGDWMDFAMNAIPNGDNATFDTTRKDYTGVFDGSWNDIATMQLIIQQFRERNKQIIADFQKNKYRYRGEYEGLSDEEKLAKAKEQREKDIDKFTDDVQRAVDAFEKAGNTLSDKQISTMMSLFNFHEGEEDDEWNSSYARRRYVEAGLPDYNAAAIARGTETVDGEKREVTKNMLDRSLVLQNAQQGYYGSSKEAANAVKDALRDFKSTYQQYNKRVKELNNKYFEARGKNKNSATTKQLSKELESLQNEYLDKLFDKLEPVMNKYGTALIGSYDVADVLEDYMGNMIPYSSIRKYGQTYSSGNDIVFGQLAEWLQKRLGRNAPTAASDKEVTNGIAEIKRLLDQGKASAARSKARDILEKIGRGSLGARNYDVETLRGYAYD